MILSFETWSKKVLDLYDGELNKNNGVGDVSIVLDIDNSSCFGRITLWESGNFFAEIIDSESGDNIFLQHGVIVPKSDLDLEFKGFLNGMSDK